MAVQKKEAKEVAETQKKDYKDMPKSRNVAGTPVYYPPNHEMFAQKEESGGYHAEVCIKSKPLSYAEAYLG